MEKSAVKKLPAEEICGEKLTAEKSVVKKLTAEEIRGEKVNRGKISVEKVNGNRGFLLPFLMLTAEKICG